jgi:very-short-patch-repair endonuclease
MHVDERIARLAGRRHGLVTIGQLRRLGLRRGAIEHRRKVGRLHPIHIGVYAVGHGAITVEGHLLAAVMACGSEAVLSHEQAALLWGMFPPWMEVDLEPVNVTVPRDSRRGRRPRIAVHRAALRHDERRIHREIPVTSPARTLADLGRHCTLRELEIAVDRSISEGLVTPGALRVVAECHRGAIALRRLLEAAERFDSITDSELEEVFLSAVREAGLPRPALNASIAGMRVDAAWRSERVAVELDGYRWHRSRMRQESDRRREARLRREGWMPLRYSARQVFDERLAVVADITRVLAERRD